MVELRMEGAAQDLRKKLRDFAAQASTVSGGPWSLKGR